MDGGRNMGLGMFSEPDERRMGDTQAIPSESSPLEGGGLVVGVGREWVGSGEEERRAKKRGGAQMIIAQILTYLGETGFKHNVMRERVATIALQSR